MTGIGADKPELKELPRQSDRISFLYLEYCKITRNDSGLLIENKLTTVEVPIATISVLLLGPGTSITHRAVELASDSGTSICWVGQDALKCYATGSPLTNTSRLAEMQAEAVSNTRKRLV